VLPLFGVALLLRLVFVALNYRGLPASPHFQNFGAEMGWTARSLATGHGFSSPFVPQTGPTALVCPLYPFLLSLIFRVFGLYTNAAAFAALALNSLFSALTAVVIYFGMREGMGKRMAQTSAWMWAVYPYAIYYSAVYLWDCALTALLFSCCFFFAITRLSKSRPLAWAGFGILCGVTALSNPSVMTLLPFLIGFAAWQRVRLGGYALRRLVYCSVALILTLTPWTVRNLRVLREPVLMRDGFWGEFYAGNAGDTSHSNPGWTHPASNPEQMRRYQELGETGYMAEKKKLSMDRLKSDPAAFVAVSLRRVVRYWTGYWSFSHAYLADEGLDVPNVPFCTALTLLMLLGAWQLVRLLKRGAFPFLMTFVIFPIPYYVTHASMDYRQAIEPVIVVACAQGSLWLYRRCRATAAVPGIEALSEAA